MGDITDLFNSVAKTKQTILKTLTSSVSTSGTSYVDGASLSVPNNWYYATFFDETNNSGTTLTWQLLEGATQKITKSYASQGISSPVDIQTIYQNTSGSTQTVKLQVKSNGAGGSPTVSLNNMSIIASPNPILYIQPTEVSSSVWNRNISLQIKAYVTSMDVLIASDQITGTGTYVPEVFYEGLLPVSDNQTTPQTITFSRMVDSFNFIGTPVATQKALYIAYDWDGKQLTL